MLQRALVPIDTRQGELARTESFDKPQDSCKPCALIELWPEKWRESGPICSNVHLGPDAPVGNDRNAPGRRQAIQMDVAADPTLPPSRHATHQRGVCAINDLGPEPGTALDFELLAASGTSEVRSFLLVRQLVKPLGLAGGTV